MKTMLTVFERHPPVPLKPLLSKALGGASVAKLPKLFELATADPDVAVRTAAIRQFTNVVDNDILLRTTVLSSLGDVPDVTLSSLARGFLGIHAEEFLGNLVQVVDEPTIRTKASAVRLVLMKPPTAQP